MINVSERADTIKSTAHLDFYIPNIACKIAPINANCGISLNAFNFNTLNEVLRILTARTALATTPQKVALA